MTYLLKPTLTRFFTETETVKKIRSAVDFAMMTVETASFSEPSPSLIIGTPGNGKTTTLLKLASEDRRIMYIQASDGDKNLNGLLKTLLNAMEVNTDRRHAADLEELVVDRLRNRMWWCYENSADHIIFVDEYQSYDLRAIRELMRICEATNVPLVLSGNDEKLKASKTEQTATDQINSRIGITVNVGNPSEKDCKNIGVSYNVEGKDAYDLLIKYGCNHSLRSLVRILDVCHSMTGGKGSVKKFHIEEAIRLLGENNQ